MSAPKKSSRPDYLISIAIAVVAAIVVYTGVSLYRSHGGSSGASMNVAQAGQNLRQTLDPNQFVGEVKQAYQIAQHDPALLAQLHCWCGCDRTDGHQNLLDCYRDTHGAHCAICTGEAIEAEKLASQGMPVEKIRDALRDRFANGE